ncbi:TlpA disulfide reductase family protein [Chitinophaga arvensicola]|uniref:Thiol-disulfide isomerase or thioredoxin n=1 Tax=Chitinophaga arvensicola TaxID=29529 RepID=A0A1I0S8E0_9BACT|nr:TlpA disulfide reductase family protein [Chitinophaga arvensicola]SEW52312.1 Thiol-disulfide isomerase or thioredoxin [Chitinophaga arvensicola]
MKSLFGLSVLLNIGLILTVSAQMPVRKGPAAPEEIRKAKVELEKDFNNAALHRKFITAMGIRHPDLPSQYRMWIQQYPGNAAIPLALGTYFYNAEMPQAREFLLKSAEIDSGNARIWNMLFVDARIRGENQLSDVYLNKAMLADTSNIGYKADYIYSLMDKDYSEFKQHALNFLNRYPENTHSVSLLYFIGRRAKSQAEKIKYFEKLYHLYPPKKFSFSESATKELVDMYMQTDPEKALAIVNESGEEGDWKIRKKLAESLILTRKLEDSKDYTNASIELNKAVLPRWNYIDDFITIRKSFLLDKTGNTNAAYDSVAAKFAQMPTDRLYDALAFYGKKIGRNKLRIDKDIAAIRNKIAVPAYAFDLGLYTKSSNLKLEDLKGKVTLLTFWFPYCSPCRAEFPYFQNVINKFSDEEVAYVGINVYPEQDDFVQLFLKNSRYSFIPLRATPEFETEYYGVSGAPQNFVIDKKGRIVFKKFQIDQDNERTLELMISGLLKM